MSDEKKSYPMLPAAHWWALREKFKQSIPGTVSLTYVASTLGMKEDSARANVIPSLRQVGLIDIDGKPQDLARSWRDDQQYSEVCRKMLEQVYPDELRSACTNPSTDKSPAERWFGHATGSGEGAVRKMVAFYTILCDADVTKKPEPSLIKSTKKPAPKQSKVDPKPDTAMPQPSSQGQSQPVLAHSSHHNLPLQPAININLQIQISPEATAEQIDKIFESMGKHIYNR